MNTATIFIVLEMFCLYKRIVQEFIQHSALLLNRETEADKQTKNFAFW